MVTLFSGFLVFEHKSLLYKELRHRQGVWCVMVPPSSANMYGGVSNHCEIMTYNETPEIPGKTIQH
jgi:hypothetical protein